MILDSALFLSAFGSALDVGFENANITNGDDLLAGTSGNDTINSSAGDDTLFGLSGNDNLNGGSQSDVIYGGDGKDTLSGDIDNDQLFGDDGLDNLFGGDGYDTLWGGAGRDSINGGSDNDLLIGGGADDTLSGGSGTDTASYHFDTSVSGGGTTGVNVNLSSLQATDGWGNTDTFTSTGGTIPLSDVENVIGSLYNDTIAGDDGVNVLDGNDGTDTLNLAPSGSGVVADLSAGTAVSAGVTDTVMNFENITGSNSSDTLTGDSGVNTLDGGSGNDILRGGLGADILIGGAGNDSILGTGAADDDDDDDDDTVSYLSDSGSVVVDLTAGTATDGFGGTDSLSGIENVAGSTFSDTFTGNSANNDFEGNGGVDTVDYSATSLGVNVTLGGSATGSEIGTDNLSGIENILGGTGNDTITGDSGNNTLTGGAGDDIVAGGGGFDTLVAGSGAGNDSYDGGAGTDTVTFASTTMGVTVDLTAGTATGTETGNDTITGVENVIGGSGDDDVTGGTGANSITGGSGSDLFRYTATTDSGIGSGNRDVIADFDGSDTSEDIVLDGLSGLSSFSFLGQGAFTGGGTAVEARYVDVGSDTIIELDVDGDGTKDMEIELTGNSGENLDSGDFTLLVSGQINVNGTQTVNMTAGADDIIIGSSGVDVITLSGAAQSGDSVDLAGSADTLTLDDVANTLTVSNVETINGGESADNVTFAAGTIDGTGLNLSSGDSFVNQATVNLTSDVAHPVPWTQVCLTRRA